jgi:GT2 family glycosyltransferase
MTCATIVIPQFGQSDLTLRCIQSFRLHHGNDSRIIVVDDGSPPSDAHAIATAHQANVDLICRPHEGVTAAWNAGAAEVDTPVIIFLNNDTTTLWPWLDELVAPLLTNVAVISGAEWRTERAVPAVILHRLPTRRFAAGWCFAVLREDFESVRGFDPVLTTYFSDTDLQSRILIHRGLGESGITIASEGRLRHVGHATTRRDPARTRRWRADRGRFIAAWLARNPEHRLQPVSDDHQL